MPALPVESYAPAYASTHHKINDEHILVAVGQVVPGCLCPVPGYFVPSAGVTSETRDSFGHSSNFHSFRNVSCPFFFAKTAMTSDKKYHR